jgi:hypothetical protein
MVGVTSPLYRRSRAGGIRFIAGHLVGLLAGGSLVAALAYSLGHALAPVPVRWRAVLLGVLLVALGLLDLAGRTPYLMRQVPQAYARSLAPGWRGLIWGFDLALLVTSQKTSSLIWGALAVAVLLAPDAAVLVPVAMVVISTLLLVVGVILDHVPDRGFITYERTLVRWGRAVAGVGLLCLGVVLTPW